MGSENGASAARLFPVPALEEQVALVKQHGMDTLLFCPAPWALRHWFVNRDTGEMVRARCDKWECPYCGPRKVDRWRQLIKLAEPTLFVTLTKVGWTLAEAARVYTTALQYVRRGSKGYGPNHVGARPAYPLECFSVLEEHRDFERVGFHWHLLAKGVDYLPKQVVSDALRSATKGRSYIVHVRSVQNVRAVGYVTKYLTKEITSEKRGMREALREVIVYGFDEQGHITQERSMQTVEVLSRARRIRYTRGFFPASTAELRRHLLTGLSTLDEIVVDQAVSPDVDEDEQQAESVDAAMALSGNASPWVLVEREEFSREIEDYRARREAALVESVEALREGRFMYSSRVVSIWAYQRKRAAITRGKQAREME